MLQPDIADGSSSKTPHLDCSEFITAMQLHDQDCLGEVMHMGLQDLADTYLSSQQCQVVAIILQMQMGSAYQALLGSFGSFLQPCIALILDTHQLMGKILSVRAHGKPSWLYKSQKTYSAIDACLNSFAILARHRHALVDKWVHSSA